MDGSVFDAVTQHLAGRLTRRGSLGRLAAVGLGAGLLASGVDAKKKHKKKKKNGPNGAQPPTCTCAPCNTCVNGACQPVGDGFVCGNAGVCSHGVCARPCTYDPEEMASDCPAGLFCATPAKPGLPSVCTADLGGACRPSECASSADCPATKTCVGVFCESGAVNLCVSVTPA